MQREATRAAIQHLNRHSYMHRCPARGHAGCLELLLQSKADVNARNKGASTPLHAAAQNDEVECGRILIRHGADVTAIDLGGGTAQESACKMGKTALAAAGVFHDPPGLNKQRSLPPGYGLLH